MRLRVRVSQELLDHPGWHLPPGYTEVERISCTNLDGTCRLTVEGPFDTGLLEHLEVKAEIRRLAHCLEWQWRCDAGPIGDPIRMPYFSGDVTSERDWFLRSPTPDIR